MRFKETLKSVFINIAKKFGLELKNKNYEMENEHNYSDIGLNPIAVGANVISTITVDDSNISIKGENKRAKLISDIAKYYQNEIRSNAVETSAGTGDCLIRPYTDGERIGINIISNNDFSIVESVGNFLKSIIIRLDGYKDDSNKFYDLFEIQRLEKINNVNCVRIQKVAYKDRTTQIALTDTVWRDMEPELIIPAEQLLLGRIKCPTVNRNDPNCVDGVPITFGCDEIIAEIKKKYNQYNEEFDRKETKIFADKTMFAGGRNKNNEGYSLPKEKVYELVLGDEKGVNSLIQEYSPAIRDDSLKNGEDFNLSILELCCGFSRGVFTTPETSFATATEMKNSLKKTFAFVKKFRNRIENGEKELFNAINILLNLNSITPIGDYEVCFDWDYGYIEETKERFNQLLQAHTAGVIDDAELRAWTMNEDLEVATNEIKRIKSENRTDDVIDE